MARLGRRISHLEELSEETADPSFDSGGFDSDSFISALSEARTKLMRGETLPETPITQEMLDDPVDGEMWRKIRDARARVRKAGG